MENEKENNGAAQPSQGSSTPKAQPQGEKDKVKEGDPNQQRPQYGSDGGPNTSTREDQLPSLNNSASGGADADNDESLSHTEDQQSGSDADQDQGGKPSI